jgi:hypothetical protein
MARIHPEIVSPALSGKVLEIGVGAFPEAPANSEVADLKAQVALLTQLIASQTANAAPATTKAKAPAKEA